MPNLLEIPSLTRYRLFMAVGGSLLLATGIARFLAEDGANSFTRLTATAAMLSYALLAHRLTWLSRHHHAWALLCVLPLIMHMAAMTYTSSLSYDMAISNLVILTLICGVVNERRWLNLHVIILCSCLISVAWVVPVPIMSPLIYTILMTTVAVIVGLLIINFHEAQDLLKRKITELNESQEFARVGTWEVDMRTLKPTWSKATYQILDLQPESEIPAISEMLSDTPANDSFAEQIEAFFKGADSYDATGQLLTGKGGNLWIHSRGTTFYEQGRPVRKFGVFSDITRHVEREQALEDAKQSAELAAEARTQFLANMSHEIRTPMNGVIGMTSLLEQETLSPTAQKYVEVIQGCSDALLATINDILDFTKLDAGKVVLESRVFRVGDLLNNSTSIVRKGIEDKGLRLDIKGDALELKLLGDPLRLEQVLVNLLSNASKFTEQGSITVQADRLATHGQRQRFSLQVIDTGIGIDPAAQETLFSPFVQADASTTRQYGGTGLGLAICQKIISHMKGELSLSSSPGTGSTFSIELELPVAELPEETTEQAAPMQLSQTIQVLLAEDNMVNQTVAKRMLGKLGLQATVVENGAEALDQIKTGSFDVVLMDLQMPVMDGLEATSHIRTLPEIRQPKIIALTANAMQEDRDRCIEVGMDDFLAKPVRLEDLRAAIAANT